MKKKIISLYVGLIALILLIGIGVIINSKIKKDQEIEIVEIVTVDSEIDSLIRNINIRYPNVVKAQIILESGHMLSTRAIRDNNLTGMKVAKARPTTAINKNNHYAIYRSIEDCIIDYALWQSQNLNLKYCRSEEQYMEFLQKNYAEDHNYKVKLQKIMKTFEKN